MNKINCSLNELRIFYFFILIILTIVSNTYSGSRFFWFGSRDKIYPTARVYLRNGTILSGFIKIYYKNTEGRDNVSLVNIEGRKIRPFETDSIIITSLVGIPYDTLWLFKIIDGKISVFNTKPLWESDYFSHIQKEESGIFKYSHELLKEHLKDNEHALTLLTTYRNSKSKVLIKYNPRAAILEYNFQTSTKRKKVEKLLYLLRKEKDIQKKISYCKKIISIDSTSYKPYLILGDYAVEKNKREEAYFYYTNYLRYCNDVWKMNKVREKIKNLQRAPIY